MASEWRLAKEAEGKPITLNSNTVGKKSIVDRVEEGFAERGLGEYNKGRVAKRIMAHLSKNDLSAIDPDTVSKFRKVIDEINKVAASWKS